MTIRIFPIDNNCAGNGSEKTSFSYTRRRLFPGFDGITCKTDPKLMFDEKNTAILTYTMLKLSGSDAFTAVWAAKSVDGGRSFAEPVQLRLIGSAENVPVHAVWIPR